MHRNNFHSNYGNGILYAHSDNKIYQLRNLTAALIQRTTGIPPMNIPLGTKQQKRLANCIANNSKKKLNSNIVIRLFLNAEFQEKQTIKSTRKE